MPEYEFLEHYHSEFKFWKVPAVHMMLLITFKKIPNVKFLDIFIW